jgi:ribonucleotide monophosphatase NagD (HAD superfamily)
MFKMALAKAGCTPRETVMIGDQLETDILGASRLGIDSVLVTSGVDKSSGNFKVLATVPNDDDLADLV